MKNFIALSVLLFGLSASADPALDIVLSSVTTDWNQDGIQDRAVLVEGEEDADLYLYLSTGDERKRTLALLKKNAAWRGVMWGTEPSLGLNDQNQVVIESGNDSVGRGRWSQSVTVIYKDNQFLVSKLVYSTHDSGGKDQDLDCTVDLVTSTRVRNGKSSKVKAKLLPLKDYTDSTSHTLCTAD